MTTYLSTFISGLQKPVEQLLKENFGVLKIHLLLDGLVLHQTDEDIKKVQKRRFLNNTFLVFSKFEKLPSKEKAFDFMFQQAYKLNLDVELKKFLPNAKTFRIIASNENQFVSVNKKLPAGELRPELAYILCYLSEPNKSDIFLDPFAGHGSIPIERAKYFSYNIVFASDNDISFKQIIRDRVKTNKVNKTIIPKIQDALDMQSFEDGFITKIVTDPPWGLYEEIKDITSFYVSMMNELLRY